MPKRCAEVRRLLWLLPLLVGCDDAQPEGDDDLAEVELWPIPNAGSWSIPPATRPRDAGSSVGAADPFDAGRGAMARDAGVLDSAPPPPPDLTLQVFDPKQVYLFGTLSEGACFRDGVAPVLDPNRAAVGFSCDASSSRVLVRPTDGRLLYTSYPRKGVLVFSCDGCVADAGLDSYPAMPETNDELIASPCADAGAFGTNFNVLPDGGVVQQCAESWLDERGQVVAPSAGPIFAFGHAGTALRKDGILSLSDAQLHPFVGLTAPTLSTYRVRADGYWVVVGSQTTTKQPELWHVGFDGTARQVGTYPALPPNQQSASLPKLDDEGWLYEFARDATTAFRDTIVRRNVQGASEVIYDEITKPRLKIHISDLFTGP